MDRNIETVLSYVNIVDEVSGFVKLKKVGQNYSGLCPFHSEKTPSFNVNGTKGLYYCFGCGKGGNVIGFLKDIKGDSFKEVIDYLKKKYNIPLEDTKLYKSTQTAVDDAPLKRILNLALNFYYENLFVYMSSSGHIIKYLNDRGIEENTARDFKLGYAGFGNGLTALLLNNKADLDIAVNAGLLIKKQEHNRGYSDRFVNKLIIPVMDRSGEPIALASRIILKEGEASQLNFPKYINTNNSEIFVKNNTLYGLDKALPFIKKENAVFVVEGYFDMITLYSKGVKNAVATMGTALSKNHIVNLSRLSDEIILLYDGDKAGINAINRGMELFGSFMESPEKNIYAVCLNDGSDPDSFVRKYGRESLIKLIRDGKKTPIEFALDYYIEKIENSGIIKNRGDERSEKNLKDKISAIREISPFLKKINNNIIFSHYLNILANRLGLKEEAVREYIYSNETRGANINADGNEVNADTRFTGNSAVGYVKEDSNIEDIIVSKIFCNLLLTEYISDDIINEFSDKNAVFIIKEIKNALKNVISKENNINIKRKIEDIVLKTENSSKWSKIYYSSLLTEDKNAEAKNGKDDFKKLLIKLKVDNINKACKGILSEIRSGLLDESGKLLKFQELNRLKYISNEFQRKICGY
jgi:DNA primase